MCFVTKDEVASAIERLKARKPSDNRDINVEDVAPRVVPTVGSKRQRRVAKYIAIFEKALEQILQLMRDGKVSKDDVRASRVLKQLLKELDRKGKNRSGKKQAATVESETIVENNDDAMDTGEHEIADQSEHEMTDFNNNKQDSNNNEFSFEGDSETDATDLTVVTNVVQKMPNVLVQKMSDVQKPIDFRQSSFVDDDYEELPISEVAIPNAVR